MNEFRRFTQLREARARSIAGAFATFLDDQIGIGLGTRQRASRSQISLRDYLKGVADDDAAFPRILRVADNDFLGGSFARHTKIWPLNDIDVFLPLDATGLVYRRGGMAAACNALTDGVLDANPLFADRNRWWNGHNVSSKKLINGFANVLRENYPSTTRVRRGGEAVTITLANDLGFDVVPCFSLKPHSPLEQPFYLIPDGDDGWIHTNPRLDQEMSDRIHRANDRTLRRSVKLFKWWVNEYIGGRIESYYAELAIMRAFENHNQQSYFISAVSIATQLAFHSVRDAVRNGDQQALLRGAPVVQPGNFGQSDMRLLNEAIEVCNDAILYERAGCIQEALQAWREVFGDRFPIS